MSQNGKGSSPRNCFSEEFRTNYDEINWSTKNMKENEEPVQIRWDSYVAKGIQDHFIAFIMQKGHNGEALSDAEMHELMDEFENGREN